MSLSLDWPVVLVIEAFPAPIYAALIQGDQGEHKLIWSR